MLNVCSHVSWSYMLHHLGFRSRVSCHTSMIPYLLYFLVFHLLKVIYKLHLNIHSFSSRLVWVLSMPNSNRGTDSIGEWLTIIRRWKHFVPYNSLVALIATMPGAILTSCPAKFDRAAQWLPIPWRTFRSLSPSELYKSNCVSHSFLSQTN